MVRKQLKKIFWLGVAIVLLVGVWVSFTLVQVVRELPRPEHLGSFQPTQSTKIYDRTGQVLLYEIHGEQNRTVIDTQDIPLHARQATLAIEDRSFYEHKGISISGITRAIWVNIISGGKERPGGSTITQQLVKNVFLTPEKTIKRKLKEL